MTVMIVESAREPFVIVPDGAHSQVLALAGNVLRRRAGLPWRHAGSMFASDGDDVACIDASTNGDIDGVRLADRSSWHFPRPRSASFGAIALVRGRLYATRTTDFGACLTSIAVDALRELPRTWRASMRIVPRVDGAPPPHIVDLGHRVFAIAAASVDGAHALYGFPMNDHEEHPTRALPATVEHEAVRAATVAGDLLVVVGGSAVADSIALYDRRTFACRLRIARDAVIPRFVVATVVEDRLVVVDDRPGVMIERIDTLVDAFTNAADPTAGARAAAAALRATWCESPIGAFVGLQAIAGTPNAIALVEKRASVDAVVWSPLARAPTTTSRGRVRDRWHVDAD